MESTGLGTRDSMEWTAIGTKDPRGCIAVGCDNKVIVPRGLIPAEQ